MELSNNCGTLIKLIAVSEKPGELVAHTLQKILMYCGHAVSNDIGETTDPTKPIEYLITTASKLTELPANTVPAVLLLADFAHVTEQMLNHAKDFADCVTDYDISIPLSADYLIDCKMLTYSSTSDNADFTARNIRTIEEGVAFEIVGVGVIGRVKLSSPDMVKTALVAASAALACRVPFADVLNALNNMKIMD